MHTYYINVMQLIANLKASNKLTKHTHTYIYTEAGSQALWNVNLIKFLFWPIGSQFVSWPNKVQNKVQNSMDIFRIPITATTATNQMKHLVGYKWLLNTLQKCRKKWNLYCILFLLYVYMYSRIVASGN